MICKKKKKNPILKHSEIGQNRLFQYKTERDVSKNECCFRSLHFSNLQHLHRLFNALLFAPQMMALSLMMQP